MNREILPDFDQTPLVTRESLYKPGLQVSESEMSIWPLDVPLRNYVSWLQSAQYKLMLLYCLELLECPGLLFPSVSLRAANAEDAVDATSSLNN